MRNARPHYGIHYIITLHFRQRPKSPKGPQLQALVITTYIKCDAVNKLQLSIAKPGRGPDNKSDQNWKHRV